MWDEIRALIKALQASGATAADCILHVVAFTAFYLFMY